MVTEPQNTSAADDVQAMPPLVVARVACVALGSALVVYGLRIPVIDRLVSGETPPVESFLAALPPICVGSLFLVLQLHFTRRVWTQIAAQAMSIMLLLVSFVTAVVEGVGQVALFPMFFAPFAIVSIWMARRQQIAAERAADVPYAVTLEVPPPPPPAASGSGAPGLKRLVATPESHFQPCEEVAEEVPASNGAAAGRLAGVGGAPQDGEGEAGHPRSAADGEELDLGLAATTAGAGADCDDVSQER